MIRTLGISALAIAFLPVAFFLLLLGIESLKPGRRRGFWMKLAVLVNSSILIATGIFGCKKPGIDSSSPDCYIVDSTDVTKIPENFEDSNDWATLENAIFRLEGKIYSNNYSEEFMESTGSTINETLPRLCENGLITADEEELLSAYCESRLDYYFHMIGGVSCYQEKDIPEGRDATKEDIIAAMAELRALYHDYKIDTPAYGTAMNTLENQLTIYTGKEDNAVLRQLLLDLADNMTGAYY